LEKQDQIWAKIFCIPKNMLSRTFMDVGLFTFIALQTKILKKCGDVIPPHDTSEVTAVLGGSSPDCIW